MRQRTVAVGCWIGVLALAALVARQWLLAVILAAWTLVAMGLANGDS